MRFVHAISDYADGTDCGVMFKETICISKHMTDSSLFQALWQLVFLKMNSSTEFSKDFNNLLEHSLEH